MLAAPWGLSRETRLNESLFATLMKILMYNQPSNKHNELHWQLLTLINSGHLMNLAVGCVGLLSRARKWQACYLSTGWYLSDIQLGGTFCQFISKFHQRANENVV